MDANYFQPVTPKFFIQIGVDSDDKVCSINFQELTAHFPGLSSEQLLVKVVSYLTAAYNMLQKSENVKQPSLPKYMIATTAIHNLGDISRKEGDLCLVFEEDGDYYIGNWVTGFGFINVKFPKISTRELTEDEIEKYNNIFIQVNNQPPIKLKVD